MKKAIAWETLDPLLRAMHQEFRDLGKKKPDGGISPQKIKMVNRLLERCREVLASELAIEFLDLLDQDDVPQNSDVVLVLSQYVAAMAHFRQIYYGYSGYSGEEEWVTDEIEEDSGSSD